MNNTHKMIWTSSGPAWLCDTTVVDLQRKLEELLILESMYELMDEIDMDAMQEVWLL